MNKKKALISGVALVLLFTGIALATSSVSSDVEIYALGQNPFQRPPDTGLEETFLALLIINRRVIVRSGSK